MFTFSKLILMSVIALFCSGSLASDSLECEFSKQLSSDYEDINDFTFQDYPWLLLKSVPGGWQVTVGGITYGDEFSGSGPDQIEKQIVSSREVLFKSTNADEKWIIRIVDKMALFSADVGNGSTGLTDIAEFICK